MDNLSIIIPAAGIGHRMKSYGPKALIPLNDNETVITRQINILRQVYPNAEIIVVIGFEAEKIRKTLPAYVRTIENYEYETTNVACSIKLGLVNKRRDNVLIVYGDLVFNINTISAFQLSTSSIIIDSRRQFGATEVGANVINSEVTRFSYGLPTKWAQIVYLTGKELQLLHKIVTNKKVDKLFGFELLNEVLDMGGILYGVNIPSMCIAEIDKSKDIKTAIIRVL